jgi:hypothetical protein
MSSVGKRSRIIDVSHVAHSGVKNDTLCGRDSTTVCGRGLFKARVSSEGDAHVDDDEEEEEDDVVVGEEERDDEANDPKESDLTRLWARTSQDVGVDANEDCVKDVRKDVRDDSDDDDNGKEEEDVAEDVNVRGEEDERTSRRKC